MEVLKKKSSTARDLTFDNIHDITLDELPETSLRVPSQSRSSIKSFITKKFHPSATSASMDTSHVSVTPNEVKQKKRRTSFRQFSQFLKRSHSAHTDLSTIGMSQNDEPASTADHLSQQKLNEEFNRAEITRSNTTSLCATLKPISEEDHTIAGHQRLTSADDATARSQSRSTGVLRCSVMSEEGREFESCHRIIAGNERAAVRCRINKLGRDGSSSLRDSRTSREKRHFSSLCRSILIPVE